MSLYSIVPELGIAVNFSSTRAVEGWMKMQDRTRELAIEMAAWLKTNYDINMVITETVTTKEQDDELQRVSATHRDGRAFDVRVIDPHTGTIILPEAVIAKFCAHFRKKYPNLGAVSGTTQGRNLIVNKPHGSGPHLHIQIKRNA